MRTDKKIRPFTSEMKRCLNALLVGPLFIGKDGLWRHEGDTVKNRTRPKTHFDKRTIKPLVKRGWARVIKKDGDQWTMVAGGGYMTEEDKKEMEEFGRFIGAKKRYYAGEPEGQDLKDLQAAFEYEQRNKN